MKTSKTTRKRVKKTKNGIHVRGAGFGHFNAKHPRKKQLKRNRGRKMKMTSKTAQRFLANIK